MNVNKSTDFGIVLVVNGVPNEIQHLKCCQGLTMAKKRAVKEVSMELEKRFGRGDVRARVYPMSWWEVPSIQCAPGEWLTEPELLPSPKPVYEF